MRYDIYIYVIRRQRANLQTFPNLGDSSLLGCHTASLDELRTTA